MSTDDADAAQVDAVATVRAAIKRATGSDPGTAAAEEVLDALVLGRPDLLERLCLSSGKRLWFGRSTWRYTPWLMRGGDEYGNSTIAVKVPGGQIVLATTVPLRRFVQPMIYR